MWSMFKDRLRAELKAAGMTQFELAQRVGVSLSAVGFWLAGSEPRLSRYERLCEVLPGLRDSEHQEAAS